MSKTRKKFKAEINQVLDIVVHSLYSNRDIFLRELISNASDAIDRARFESLSNQAIVSDDPEWRIKLRTDAESKLLTISDNGIGMTAEEMEKNIGTIANSGTKRFLEELKSSNRPAVELIGQFGVGFYSAFMVADRITVLSRSAITGEATRWESEGDGTFSIETAEKSGRGTDIILQLKEDATEYLEEWKLRKIVKQYSDFVEHPVQMDVTRTINGEDENSEESEAKVEIKTET